MFKGIEIVIYDKRINEKVPNMVIDFFRLLVHVHRDFRSCIQVEQ